MGTQNIKTAVAAAVCLLFCVFIFCLWKFLKLGPIGPALTIIIAVLAPSIFKMVVLPCFPDGHPQNPGKGPDIQEKE